LPCIDDARAIRDIDGATVGEELRRIGDAGDAKPVARPPCMPGFSRRSILGAGAASG
jgi:hypothetical protein